jgi:hypothetical protein
MSTKVPEQPLPRIRIFKVRYLLLSSKHGGTAAYPVYPAQLGATSAEFWVPYKVLVFLTPSHARERND